MRALFRVIPVLLVLGPVLGLVFGAAAALAAPLALKVDAALASFDSTGAAVVNARLEPESGRAFAEFTAANVGRRVEFRVDGEAVAAPVIRDPITGGEIVISGSMTAEDAGRLAMRLRGGALIEVEIVPD
jgi:preprotein translocase subunit SecD